jgi:hypothetical protein
MAATRKRRHNCRSFNAVIQNRDILSEILRGEELESALYRRTNRLALMLARTSKQTQRAVAAHYTARKLIVSGTDSRGAGAPPAWGLSDILYLAAAAAETSPLKVVCLAPRTVSFAPRPAADTTEERTRVLEAAANKVAITLVSSPSATATGGECLTRGPANSWPLLPAQVGGCLAWEESRKAEPEGRLQSRWNPYQHTEGAARDRMAAFLRTHVSLDASERTIAIVGGLSHFELDEDMIREIDNVASCADLERLSVSLPWADGECTYPADNTKREKGCTRLAAHVMRAVYEKRRDTLAHISMHVPALAIRELRTDPHQCSQHPHAEYVDWAAEFATSAPADAPFFFSAELIEQVLFTRRGSIALGIGEFVAVTSCRQRGGIEVFTLKLHIDIVSMRFGGICGHAFATELAAAMHARTDRGHVIIVEDLTVTLHRDTDKNTRENVFYEVVDDSTYERTIGTVRDLLRACGAIGASPPGGRSVKCKTLTLRLSPAPQTSLCDRCACHKICNVRRHHSVLDLPARLLVPAHGDDVPCADCLRVPTVCLYSLLSQDTGGAWHVRGLEAFAEPNHRCGELGIQCAKGGILQVPDVDGFDFPTDAKCKYATPGLLLKTMTVDADPSYIENPDRLEEYVQRIMEALNGAPENLENLHVRLALRRRSAMDYFEWSSIKLKAKGAIRGVTRPRLFVCETDRVGFDYKGARGQTIRVWIHIPDPGLAP